MAESIAVLFAKTDFESELEEIAYSEYNVPFLERAKVASEESETDPSNDEPEKGNTLLAYEFVRFEAKSSGILPWYKEEGRSAIFWKIE